MNQKPLKTTNSFTDESFKFTSIPRNNTTIEPNIDPTLTKGSINLLLKTSNRSSRGNSIKGHIHDGSNATKGSSLSARVEALPFRAARLVQMHMGIDQTREQDVGRVVEIRRAGREIRQRDYRVEDGRDLATALRDNDRGSGKTARDNGARRNHHGD